MSKIRVIYDGDMGGDDLWAMAMMLAHRERFDIAGIVSVFGNVDGDCAVRNLLNFLHWLKIDDIPVVQGADRPYDGMRPFGDDAYGADGVGGLILPQSPRTPESVDATGWYDRILSEAARKNEKITIFSTGPATNLALLLEKHPHHAQNIAQIILMSGGITPPGRNGRPVMLENGKNSEENGIIRKGNITPYAEFNAYQDPHALNILLRSGAACVFMAADATQYMVLTPPRQTLISRMHDTYGPAFHRMLMVVEALDRSKFGVDGPFIHDPNVVIYALNPDLYQGVRLPRLGFTEKPPANEHRGEAHADFAPESRAEPPLAPPLWLNRVSDEEAVFALMLESLGKICARSAK